MRVIDSLLKHQYQRSGQIAFCDGERSIGYHELFVRAERIASELGYRGVRPGDRVAMLLPRGVDAACCIYGILFAGACYVPLDLQNPTARLAYIIGDVQPAAVIGAGVKPAYCGDSVDWLDIDSDIEQGNVSMDHVDVVYHSGPDDLAAILYTSGSTGNPKGVAISCRAVNAFVAWASTTFVVDENDRIAALAPFHFDLSLFDLFVSVYVGACCCFVPQRLTMAPVKLVAWMEDQRISCWYTVPSILSFLVARGGLQPDRLPALRCLLFAGEVFPLPKLRRLAAQLPHVALYNLFGPTETNVCACWPVDRQRLEHCSALPIGHPASDCELRIDASGELLVAGPCVMSGYWQQGRLQPVDGHWLATGDRVSMNQAGELEYHGRMDRMIKSSGYRIEPAEIEAVINAFDGVEVSLVIGEDDPICGQRLVAAVVGNSVDVGELRIHLRMQLAAYMQPYRLVQLDALPLLSNGKTDMINVRKRVLEETL